MTKPDKHHIVPIYKCKELGLTTSYKINGKEFYFKENMVEVTRHQHALIHWGYKCNDLKPLLEVCNPPQWVIDMIPLGDNRDSGAASFLALGEIEQIDASGKNSPVYKHGLLVGDSPEIRKKYNKINSKKHTARSQKYYYENREDIMEDRRIYAREYYNKNKQKQRDKSKAYNKINKEKIKEIRNRPENKEKKRISFDKWYAIPENKQKASLRNAKQYAKRKIERKA